MRNLIAAHCIFDETASHYLHIDSAIMINRSIVMIKLNSIEYSIFACLNSIEVYYYHRLRYCKTVRKRAILNFALSTVREYRYRWVFLLV